MAAEVRAIGSVVVAERRTNLFGGESGIGGGLELDLLGRLDGRHQFVDDLSLGARLAWTTWTVDRDNTNGESDSRVHHVAMQFVTEYRIAWGAVAAGLGLDRVTEFDSTWMLGLSVQLTIDLACTRYGRWSVVGTFEKFPLIDLHEILSNGAADGGPRGVSGSLGLALRR